MTQSGATVRPSATGVGARDLVTLSLPTGPGGDAQQWTLFSVGLEGILGRFVIPS